MSEPITLETIAQQLEQLLPEFDKRSVNILDGLKALQREVDGLKHDVNAKTAGAIKLFEQQVSLFRDDITAARLRRLAGTDSGDLKSRVEDIDRRVTSIERVLNELNEGSRKMLEVEDDRRAKRRSP